MLLAGSGGVYALEEDLADVLTVARLQFGAKDVGKDVDNGLRRACPGSSPGRRVQRMPWRLPGHSAGGAERQ
jgi:hypothetical protein